MSFGAMIGLSVVSLTVRIFCGAYVSFRYKWYPAASVLGTATFLFLLGSVSVAWAQPAPWPPAPTELVFSAIEDIKQGVSDIKLGNGTVVPPTDWPSSFSATYRIGGLAFSCTSTLIGSRALLTAAHCIADGGRVQITKKGIGYAGTCEKPHPGYPELVSADWALCLMDNPVPALRYETVSLEAASLRRNSQLTLAGYGCQRIGSGTDGKFRIGPAIIEHSPGSMPENPNWLATYSALTRGDAFICPGDSGGAAFQDQPGLDRRVVAVNSHYDIAGTGVSYLSVLGTSAGIAFLKDWAARHGQRLCGMHEDAQNCRV